MKVAEGLLAGAEACPWGGGGLCPMDGQKGLWLYLSLVAPQLMCVHTRGAAERRDA